MEKKAIKVRASYLRQRGYWMILVDDGGPISKLSSLLFMPSFDFSGKKTEKAVENLANELAKFGVTKKQIDEAILKECKTKDLKPPKYLR